MTNEANPIRTPHRYGRSTVLCGVDQPAEAGTGSKICEHIQQLKTEFFANKYADYIDLYNNTYAMMKFIYHYDKYLEPGLRRSMTKWCEAFNSANTLLKEITGKKEKLIPVPEVEMIRL